MRNCIVQVQSGQEADMTCDQRDNHRTRHQQGDWVVKKVADVVMMRMMGVVVNLTLRWATANASGSVDFRVDAR